MKRILIKVLKTSPYDYINYLRSFRKKQEDKTENHHLIDEYLSANENPKLQIGCGYNLVDGWLNSDLVPSSDQVAALDASIEFPFNSNSFDFVYSEHILEHLDFKASCNMISESYRVLKPRGSIRIAIPHAGFLIDIYQNPTDPIHKEYIAWAMDLFCKDVVETVGSTDHNEIYVLNNFYRNWGHKVIHNFGSLKQLLETFGFSEVKQMEVSVSGFKEFENMERHGDIIPEKFNKLETLVVEARKP